MLVLTAQLTAILRKEKNTLRTLVRYHPLLASRWTLNLEHAFVVFNMKKVIFSIEWIFVIQMVDSYLNNPFDGRQFKYQKLDLW